MTVTARFDPDSNLMYDARCATRVDVQTHELLQGQVVRTPVARPVGRSDGRAASLFEQAEAKCQRDGR